MSSMAHLDFMAALRYNPLVVLAVALVVCWVACGLFDLLSGRALVPRLNGWLVRHRFWWIAAVLAGLNWAYLLFNPP